MTTNSSLSMKAIPSLSVATSPTSISVSPTMDTEVSSTPRQSPSREIHFVNIEHSVKNDTRKCTVRRISKPILALGGTLFLLATGSAAYLLSEFLTIPGLKTQINRLEEQVGLLEKQVDELEAQVDRLSSEVDRLENEVDRFSNETNKLSDLNDELELNVANYTIQNILLNFSLATYAQLNEELNETVVLLEMQVDKLEDQVTLYEMLNDDLNETARELTLKVDDLASLNRQISETNGQLWIAIEQLSNETSELSVLNEELNNTVSELGNQIARMAAEIDRLENISLNLATLVGFINKTALEFDETFDAFSAKIAQQIDYNRALVIQTLENLYKQRTAFWDCDFREYFLTEQFVQNRWVPIGKEMYPRVLAYIEERILSDLCLSTSNFEEFLGYEFVGSLDRRFNISFNELQRAVGLYTDNAENYFFPSGNATGVLPSTWAAADYKCANLPPDAMYLYHSSSPVKSNEYHS